MFWNRTTRAVPKHPPVTKSERYSVRYARKCSGLAQFGVALGLELGLELDLELDLELELELTPRPNSSSSSD